MRLRLPVFKTKKRRGKKVNKRAANNHIEHIRDFPIDDSKRDKVLRFYVVGFLTKKQKLDFSTYMYHYMNKIKDAVTPDDAAPEPRITITKIKDYDCEYKVDLLTEEQYLDFSRRISYYIKKAKRRVAPKAKITVKNGDQKMLPRPSNIPHQARPYEHRKAQEEVKKLESYQCLICKRTSKQTSGHHLIFYRDGGPPSIYNMITLCTNNCHGGYHRGNKDIDVYRA